MDRDQITAEVAARLVAGFAADLAGFLAALYAIDASGGPPPGRHNWYRGGSLSTWDEQTRRCLDRLAAGIDFGCAAVGDPACDLVMAWTFFPDGAAAIFRRGLPADEATWARARGWALWKALTTLGSPEHSDDDGQEAARRFGWRYSPRQVISRIITDHAIAIGL